MYEAESPEQRDVFAAFLEASIIFARIAIHRLHSQFEHHPDWRAWFASLKDDPAVSFFREHRDLILKEGPPKVSQTINFIQSIGLHSCTTLTPLLMRRPL